MNSLIFALRIIWRIAFLVIAYLIAKIFLPGNAIWWALGAYWIYFLVGWAYALLYRASLHKIDDIKLGMDPPRFFSPKGILSELALIADNIENGEKGHEYRSPGFPLKIDSSMDDVINSMSRLNQNARAELFKALANDASNRENSKSYYVTFWRVILRLASRAVRDSEPSHIVRGVYAAQAALICGADYRDVLVSYSAIWDAARRLRVYIKPVTREIASTTPNLDGILTTPPAGIKSMALTKKKDEYGFRYDYDETWPS